MPTIALVTGGGADYQPYIRAAVNSICHYNSPGYPVYVLDMGFTEPFRDWVRGHRARPVLVPLAHLDPYRDLVPGADYARSKVGYVEAMSNSFRKLCALREIDEEYFYWIDADAILLRDIGVALPTDYAAAPMYGSRSTPQATIDELLKTDVSAIFAKQLRRNPIAPQAAQILERYPDIARNMRGFNAGMFLIDRPAFVAAMARHGGFFLEHFSDSIFADQGFLNLVGSAAGWDVRSLPPGVNMSPSDDPASFTVDAAALGSDRTAVTIRGKPIVILHFLLDSKPAITRSFAEVAAEGDAYRTAIETVYRYFHDLN